MRRNAINVFFFIVCLFCASCVHKIGQKQKNTTMLLHGTEIPAALLRNSFNTWCPVCMNILVFNFCKILMHTVCIPL